MGEDVTSYNLYRTGDTIYVKGTIQYVQVVEGKVLYKIKEAAELIPEDKICDATEVVCNMPEQGEGINMFLRR